MRVGVEVDGSGEIVESGETQMDWTSPELPVKSRDGGLHWGESGAVLDPKVSDLDGMGV